MKKTILFISICVLCLTAQAQVVKGVSRTGEVGTAEQNLQFVDQFGRIVVFPALSPTGEVLDAMRPSVLTNSTVTDITKNSAVTGGKVIAQGASAVTECGVCYGTSSYPTIIDYHLSATPDANGNFTVNLPGLQPNTTYYVRAYATNEIGTSYGTAIPFTTRGDATITITGKSESKVYNGSEQSLTGYTVSIPDGVNIDATEVTYSGNSAATGTNMGEYTLTLSAADFHCTNSNYDVIFQVTNGTLSITPATATVTAVAQTKEYGADDPELTATVTGLQGNDAASLITYSVTRAAGEDVGTYTITPSGNVTQGNYNVTYVPANLTITKATATVTITGNTDSKTYNGSEQSVTGYNVSIPNGVNITESQISYSSTAVAKGTNVGTYPMGLTQDNFSCSNDNYTVNFSVTDGSLTINTATATVTADAQTKEYGAADPELTATVTGLQGTDAASLITYNVARATGEDVGTYAITPSGDATQGNYNVTYVPANLTINKATATVTITGNTDTKTYNESEQSVTGYNVSIPSGVNISESQISYSGTATATGTAAGTYSMGLTANAFSCSNGNYEVTFSVTDGYLIITCPTVLPSFGEYSSTSGTAKTSLFKHEGVKLYAYINDYNESIIIEKGFYYSTVKSEVDNHTSSTIAGSYGTVNIKKYTGTNYTGEENVTALYAKIDISSCGKKIYYQPYMKVMACGAITTIYGSTTKDFEMWAPDMTLTANPSSISVGSNSELTARATMNVSSWPSVKGLASWLCSNANFSGVQDNGTATMETWMSILSTCSFLASSMGYSASNASWGYQWSDNGSTNNPRTVSPTQTTTYTVTGIFTYKNVPCEVSKNVEVTVLQP